MQGFNEPGLVSGTRCSGCVGSFPTISFPRQCWTQTKVPLQEAGGSGGREAWASLGSTAGGMDGRAGEAFLKVGRGGWGGGAVLWGSWDNQGSLGGLGRAAKQGLFETGDWEDGREE